MKNIYLNILPFLILFTLLTIFVSNNIFFWDTVQLGAKHGLHFYETGFAEWLLPDDIDSGHIPVFGMYLALVWMIFEKSLLVSHLSMLPFLVGIVIQSFYLVRKYVPQNYLWLAMSIFLFEPTLLGQSVLISPDIPLVFFFLLALNSILNNHRFFLLTGILGLFLISMRGGMLSFALLLLDLFFNYKKFTTHPFITLLKMSWSYLPGFILFCIYNYVHYSQKNWIGYHAESPWASSFQHVGYAGILKNIIVLAWRLLDFGRVFLWIAGLLLAFGYFSRYSKDNKLKELVIIFLVILTSSSVSFLLYKGLNAHRYILPAYLTFALLVIYMLFNSDIVKKTWIGILLCIGLLSGHLWVYPSNISQGWDASLAHLPYYGLREKILSDMKAQNIEVDEVACVFPNQSQKRFMDLSNSMDQHTSFDHNKSKYVLYSNVYNDFTDEDVKMLAEQYKVLIHLQNMEVFMTLYERK